MRLAYVCLDRGIPIPGQGGAYQHIAAIVSALAGLGHQVVLFRVEGEGPVPGAERVVQVRAGHAAGEMRALLRGSRWDQEAKELWSLFLNSEAVARLKGEHERQPFDAVVERLSVWSFAVAVLCEQLGIPHLLEVNARLIEEQGKHFGIALEEGAQALHQFVARRTRAILCVSEALADDYRALTAAPVGVLPNGVDLDVFRPGVRSKPRPDWASRDSVCVAFVGTMKRFHDLEAVCEAALRLPGRFKLVMAGDGPGSGLLRDSEAARSGRLILLGRVAHEDVPGFLGWCALGLAPTGLGYEYLSPLKLPEYLAMGLPVVVGRGAQGDRLLPAAVKEIYEPGSGTSLAAAIERLEERVAANPDALCAAARSEGEKRGWEAVARRYVEVVEGLLSSSASR